MFNEKLKKRIVEVWNMHIADLKKEVDEEGNTINNIDDGRLYAIEVVKIIIHNFLKGDFNLIEFKNALDSYNKHNNLWGFTAKLGQMYFNQLIKANENNLDKLTATLKDLILEPKNLRDALSKIETLEKLTMSVYSKSKDKHNAPYPGAVGFFLSYFWQIYNHQKWPILYNTLINSFKELGIWEEQKTQRETYELYYRVYNEVKDVVEDAVNKSVTFWEVEHALWNYKFKPVLESIAASPVKSEAAPAAQVSSEPIKVVTDAVRPPVKVSLGNNEYVIPRLSRILHEDFDAQVSPQLEEEYTGLVLEVFGQLDFEINDIERSDLSNANAVLKYKEEEVAIILDIRTSGESYLRSDRRAVKDYINEQCRKLRRDGYSKLAYMVVADSFEYRYQEFVSYLQWNCDIRKVTLISDDALLSVLSHKVRNKTPLYSLIEKLSALPTVTNNQNIAHEFGN